MYAKLLHFEIIIQRLEKERNTITKNSIRSPEDQHKIDTLDKELFFYIDLCDTVYRNIKLAKVKPTLSK